MSLPTTQDETTYNLRAMGAARGGGHPSWKWDVAFKGETSLS